MTELTQEIAQELLEYDEETGKLFWKNRDVKWFQGNGSSAMLRWNACRAGKEAFTAKSDGYRRGIILGKHYRAHRVIWLWMTGEWPENQIDHINGNRSDNRFDNLRIVSHAENQSNKKLYKNNTTNAQGIYWHEKNQNWMAKIGVNGESIYLGSFENIKDAIDARKSAEIKYGFHENHGRIID